MRLKVSWKGWTTEKRRGLFTKSSLRAFFLGLTALFHSLFFTTAPTMAAEKILVFAAASMTAPVSAAIAAFNKENTGSIVPSFAGSSTLAQQVARGAPASLFISANEQWVSFLHDQGLLVPNSKIEFVTNALVLVGSKARDKEAGTDMADLLVWLGDNRLAVGDPDHVPAGIYAKAALTSYGLWQAVQPKLVRQPNVASALALVERNEVPYAIVYATDALRSKHVEIVAEFSKKSYPTIKYSLAKVKGHSNPVADQFYDYLLSKVGQEFLQRFGFLPLSDN